MTSAQVAWVTRLLSALRSPEKGAAEEELEEAEPSGEPAGHARWDQPPAPQASEQREEHPFPNHVAALSEYHALSLFPLALQPLFRP